MLASSGERMPPCGVPVIVSRMRAVLGEDAGLQERLDQRQDALVPDPIAHPAHQGRVVDLVEARRDVAPPAPTRSSVGGRSGGSRRSRPGLGASGGSRSEHGLKSASKIGSSTSFRAACTTRSRAVGMPSRRSLPVALGIIRSRTGSGRTGPP